MEEQTRGSANLAATVGIVQRRDALSSRPTAARQPLSPADAPGRGDQRAHRAGPPASAASGAMRPASSQTSALSFRRPAESSHPPRASASARDAVVRRRFHLATASDADAAPDEHVFMSSLTMIPRRPAPAGRSPSARCPRLRLERGAVETDPSRGEGPQPRERMQRQRFAGAVPPPGWPRARRPEFQRQRRSPAAGRRPRRRRHGRRGQGHARLRRVSPSRPGPRPSRSRSPASSRVQRARSCTRGLAFHRELHALRPQARTAACGGRGIVMATSLSGFGLPGSGVPKRSPRPPPTHSTTSRERPGPPCAPAQAPTPTRPWPRGEAGVAVGAAGACSTAPRDPHLPVQGIPADDCRRPRVLRQLPPFARQVIGVEDQVAGQGHHLFTEHHRAVGRPPGSLVASTMALGFGCRRCCQASAIQRLRTTRGSGGRGSGSSSICRMRSTC